MTGREILVLGFLPWVISGCTAMPPRITSPARDLAAETSPFSQLPSGGRFSLHGMVVIGSGPYFLEHIPMLHAPHDFQIVAEVILSDESGNPIAANLSEQGFTLEPSENFSLNDYLASRFKTFKGSVHKGSFEQGGKTVPGLESVNVEITAFRLVRQLPSEAAETMFEFKDAKHTFRTNIITPQRNFQRIENIAVKPALWCVVGPDFFNPCK